MKNQNIKSKETIVLFFNNCYSLVDVYNLDKSTKEMGNNT
jgi:hypothetical protein